MKIGINGYEAVVPRFGYNQNDLPVRVGSGEYAYQLLMNLAKIDKKNEYFIYLPFASTSDLPKESINWHYKIVKKRSIWMLFDLSFSFLKDAKIDVFFSPTHYLPLFMPFPSVISILDLSYIKYPQLFKKRDLYQLKLWSKYSVRRAKKILTISQSSKDDIIKIYGVPEEKIVVTYPGIKLKTQMSNLKTTRLPKPGTGGQATQNSKLLKEKYGIEGSYILFVGTLQPRKNIIRLIEAFSKIVQGPIKIKDGAEVANKIFLGSGRDEAQLVHKGIGPSRPSENFISSPRYQLSLVIAGKKGWMYEKILAAPKKFGVEDKVKFLDFVSDEDLPSLYKNALCFVLTSLYEGFGLPVLEAIQNGCPVITSNISSLPEAGGDAALYVNPEDMDDIAEKIQKVISNEKLRHDMISKGYEQVKKFSWEKTARETLEALEQIAKNK